MLTVDHNFLENDAACYLSVGPYIYIYIYIYIYDAYISVYSLEEIRMVYNRFAVCRCAYCVVHMYIYILVYIQ